MKTLSLPTLLLLLVGCSAMTDSPSHRLRVANRFYMELSVAVGGVDFGSVGEGRTTGYRSVSSGALPLSGDLEGTVTLDGGGENRWTLTVTEEGGIALRHD